MSLQIWLPLNKSGVNGGLLNYGLYDIGDSSKSYNHGMAAASTSNDYYQSTTAPNYLRIEHENVKQWSGSFSFSIRLRIDSWNTNWETYVYAGQGGAAWDQYIFGLSRTDANSGLQFVIGDGNATTQTNCNVTGLSTGVWYHFVCTYQSGVVKIYKDGLLVKSVNTDVVPNFSLINYFLIGAVNSSGTYQTKSSYQDFRLYDHALSDAEVKHIYDSISTLKQDTSLAVWLPLTKDTHNQGTDNSGSFASTTAWANEGKVGAKALLSNANLTATFNKLKNITNFSLCFWIKIDSSLDINAWQDIVELDVMTGSSAGQIRPEFTNTKGQFQVLIGKDTTVGSQYNYYGVNGNIGITATQFMESAKDKWAHCVIAKDNNYSYTYLNGTLVNKSASTAYEKSPQKLTGVMHLGWTQSTAAMVNDVRVYTKCLNADEVKKIAQGLVLHYLLNRNGWGQENLLSRYVVPGQYGPTSTVAGGRTTWLGDYKITIPATENADTYFRLFMSEQLVSGQTYTISCQVDGLLNGSVYRFPMFAQSNTAMGVLNLDHNGLNSLTFTMNWTGTQTAATGANGETVYVNFLDDSARTIASGQGPITISNFKLEKGDKVTPWCPNVLDFLYDAMGLNSTTEYDCSGFCNNGTKNGTYSYTSNTPKYAVSTNFSGTETIATATTGADILTLSCWAKTSKSRSTSQMMVADSASKLCCSFYQGNFISFYGGNSGFDTGSRCFLGSEYKENEWNHFVSVKTGEGTRDCYCNGVKLTPTTNDWWSTVAGFWIGNRNIGGNIPFYGQICDVRAYATALSAEEVQELYNMGRS